MPDEPYTPEIFDLIDQTKIKLDAAIECGRLFTILVAGLKYVEFPMFVHRYIYLYNQREQLEAFLRDDRMTLDEMNDILFGLHHTEEDL